jgi:hypothetical protein
VKARHRCGWTRTGPSGFRDHEHEAGACVCVVVCVCLVCIRVTELSARNPRVSGRICALCCCCWHLFLARRRLSHPEEFCKRYILGYFCRQSRHCPLFDLRGNLYSKNKETQSERCGLRRRDGCTSLCQSRGAMRYIQRWFRAQPMERHFLQVCRLCGQDPCQPATDGDRHQREALHGTLRPLVVSMHAETQTLSPNAPPSKNKIT